MLDVLVVGGGQAGLAAGYYLARRGLSFTIIEACPEVAHGWRSRWDSLTLFTPSQYDALPGMAFPAEHDVYPTKDEVASYLREYAERFSLPVRTGHPVTSLRQRNGAYVALLGTDELEATQVIVATGPFQVPFVPAVSGDVDPAVLQIHSADYRKPGQLPRGRVLVVGAANSGCQIAHELADTHQVELSAGRRAPVLPQRLLGRDIWWWGTTLRVPKVTIESSVGERLSQRDPLIGVGPRHLTSRHGVRLHPRVDGACGGSVIFADGSTAEPAAIVWATGYRTDFSWIDIPGVLDARGLPVHRRGVTAVRGVYFLGLEWMWTRGSALLGWVGDDADYIARHVISTDAGVPGA
jgi:putative flavoprotein involved in K+ transport